MDCYFLKIKITEFTLNSNKNNLQNIDNNSELENNKDLINTNNNYEIEFELNKSNQKYTLKIINDNNGNKIPISNYFILPTIIKIDNNNNDIFKNDNSFIDKDFLEVSLYLNNEDKKLIDIDSDIVINNDCISKPKCAELYLGIFKLKFLFKLSCFEDLSIRQNDMILNIDNNENKNNEDNFNNIYNINNEENYNNIENNNNETNNNEVNNINHEIVNNENNDDENNNDENNNNNNNNEEEEEEEDLVEKYHNLFSSKPIEDDLIYDEDLFQKIEPIDFEINNEKKTPENENEKMNELNINTCKNDDSQCDIYRQVKTIDFFDINVDILEEEENEDDEYDNNLEKKEIANININDDMNNNNFKIYNNTHLIIYENINLEKPKLTEIIKDNLIECFLISGLSQNKKELPNSESYTPQCKHKNCQYYKSYISDIIYRLQKPGMSNFSEIDSSSISNLIFPYGIKICFGKNCLNPLFKKRSSSQFQEAEYSFNILTDIKGKRYYIYSLIFFIQFEYKEFIKYFKEYENINIKSSTIISKNINNNTIFIPFAFSLISKIYNLENFNKILNDVYTVFYSSQMDNDTFDNELIHLIFELPSPPINSKIKLYLPYSDMEIKSNIYENKIFNNLNYYHILFQKNCYSICFIIKIFILILLEKKVLIHSSKQNKIYETIEVILNLIYPLKWVNVYIPLIPDENINLILQSFLPFIVGMIHQSFFNCANKIEKLNSGNNNQNEKYDNIFVINLDTENILPTKTINELVNICPIYEIIEEKYHKEKDNGEINSDKIRNIFLEGMVDAIGDYERYTSKLGENNLFNQKIFLRNKEKKYYNFYQDITSTQQFYQFINEINNNDIYFSEFKEKIKNLKNSKNKTILKKNSLNLLNNKNKEFYDDIYLDEYNLYTYFFKKENKDDIDLFSF